MRAFLAIACLIALSGVAMAELDQWQTDAAGANAAMRKPLGELPAGFTVIRYDAPQLTNQQEQAVIVGQENNQLTDNTNVNIGAGIAANVNSFGSNFALGRLRG